MSKSLISEDHILEIVDHFFPRGGNRLLQGRGDDCCVLTTNAPLAISTDVFMEDVHFRRSYFTPFDIGWKSLATNISDLAAEGACPVGFSLGLALPPDSDEALVQGIFEGMAELANPFNLVLTGGDLSRAEKLHICITVFGDVSEKNFLQRRRAQCGDIIFLCGAVGLARAGLLLLEQYGRNAVELYPQLCSAHLHPYPHVEDGLALSQLQVEHGARISLMDVSDGLARDLPRLLGKFGADIILPNPHAELTAWAGDESLHTEWLGGEDYALLGTCDAQHIDLLLKKIPSAQVIGTVTHHDILWNGHLAHPNDGFDHFR